MTDYNLETASIEENENEVTISQGGKCVKYCLDDRIAPDNTDLKKTIGALDRAYAVIGSAVRVTQIQREKWPIQGVNCRAFETSFFSTAKFEGAFRVFETIHYDWLPSKTIRI